MPENRIEKGDIWYATKDNKVTVGFMSDFLKRMTDCWHISPVGRSVEKESPLMVLEMGDELLSIMSPSKGVIESFSTLAQNFPEQLTEEHIVCVINEKAPKPAATSRAAPTPTATFNSVGNWADFAPSPAPRGVLPVATWDGTALVSTGTAPTPRRPANPEVEQRDGTSFIQRLLDQNEARQAALNAALARNPFIRVDEET